MKKTATARKVWLESHGQWAHFVHRDAMARKRPMAKAGLPAVVPVTILPVDCTGNATVSCPMLGNNKYGDCGPVMCAHTDQIRSFGQGKPGFVEVVINEAALIAQYEKISGGDNGTDEDMLVGPFGAWTVAGGGLAGDPTAVVADHLDVDVTDVPLAQYCIDQFYTVCVAWSVPDGVLQKFAQGVVFASADVPDPNNGHYTPITDVAAPGTMANGVDVGGFYRLYTWGAWCWVSPAFLASVQPQSFTTFSALQFKKADGYDSHGRHVSDQAAKWVAMGGDSARAALVVAQFPAKVAPPPPPPPPVPSPTATATYAQASAWVADGINSEPAALFDAAQAIAAAQAGLAKGYAGQPS